MAEKIIIVAIAAVAALGLGIAFDAGAQSLVRLRQRTVCVGVDPTYLVTTSSTLTQRSALFIQNGNDANAIYCSMDPELVPSVSLNRGVYIAPRDSWTTQAWRSTGYEPVCITSVTQTSATGCTTAIQYR